MMYYYIPKAANRPVYSYRLSIIHFWSLVFLYIWAGPHHLHYTSLPDWAQTLGMVFSVMLWMPSWGGMINGLMTLSGAWDKLRTDPGLRFSVPPSASTAWRPSKARSCRSRPSIRSAITPTGRSATSIPARWAGSPSSSSARCTTWCRRCGTGRRCGRRGSIGWHYWIATIGIVLYITAMWVSGIMQGLMWRAYDELGFLQYSFVETVAAMKPFYMIRLLGGLFFLSGGLIMAYNMWRTIRGEPEVDRRARPRRHSRLRRRAMFIRHEKIEKNVILMVVLTLITVSIGGLVQIIPLFTIESTIERVDGVRPYTPLELMGRNIYVREGCYLCHSQQIRPFKDEVERYGHYSLAAESMYDQPFQWGSKRTGPDLARVGGRYSNDWHVAHLDLAARRRAGKRDAGLSLPGRSASSRTTTSPPHSRRCAPSARPTPTR